jgi:hypothetical protein
MIDSKAIEEVTARDASCTHEQGTGSLEIQPSEEHNTNCSEEVVYSDTRGPPAEFEAEENGEKQTEQQKDYSVFGPWEKKFIVFAATMGAFYSPFSTQIYFPALTSIASSLQVTDSKINLTMTTYMVSSHLNPSRNPC